MLVLVARVSCDKIEIVYAEKLDVMKESYWNRDEAIQINAIKDMSERIKRISTLEEASGEVHSGVKLMYGSETKDSGLFIEIEKPDYYCLEKNTHAEMYFYYSSKTKLEFVYNVKYDNGGYETRSSVSETRPIEGERLCFFYGYSSSSDYAKDNRVHLYFNFFTDPSKIDLRYLFTFSLFRIEDFLQVDVFDKQASIEERDGEVTTVRVNYLMHRSSCVVDGKEDFKFLLNGQEFFIVAKGFFSMAFLYDRTRQKPAPSDSDFSSVSGESKCLCVKNMAELIFAKKETELDLNLKAMEDLDSLVPKLLENFDKLDVKIPKSLLERYHKDRQEGKIKYIYDLMLMINLDIRRKKKEKEAKLSQQTNGIPDKSSQPRAEDEDESPLDRGQTAPAKQELEEELSYEEDLIELLESYSTAIGKLQNRLLVV